MSTPARPSRAEPALLLSMVCLLAFSAGCGARRSGHGSTETGSATATAPATRSATAGPPAQLLATRKINARTLDLTIASPALNAEVKVRLLLPARFTPDVRRSWPTLYLLHGCCDSYLSWTRSTDVEQLTADQDLIVVMPDGGKAGFYSDWRTGPAWETFHTDELPQLLAKRYQATGPRAVAGVSMGGLGALSYTARHPGMFTAAASFSGIVHTLLSDQESQNYLGLLRSQGEEPLNLWGDPDRDATTWAEHNPYDLAEQLRGVDLYLSVGNGQPGPLDPAGTSPDDIEPALQKENQALIARLRELGIPAQTSGYGPGTHNWPYWQRELHHAWPMLTAQLTLR